MRVLPETKGEVKVQVELTGPEIQLIVRALSFVESPENSDLSTAEVRLLGEFESLAEDNDLEDLPKYGS